MLFWNGFKNRIIYPFLDVTEHLNDDNENNNPSWTPTCSEDKFLCEQSGECVNFEQLCDQHVDCIDGHDEIGKLLFFQFMFFKHKFSDFFWFFSACGVANPDRTCPNNEFPCDADQCIPDSKICNGFNDCMDGSDEYLYLYYWRHLSIQNQSINCV